MLLVFYRCFYFYFIHSTSRKCWTLFLQGVLVKNIAKMENDLNLAKNRFEPSKITELQVLDKRLRGSSEILSRHIAISPIFQALQTLYENCALY